MWQNKNYVLIELSWKGMLDLTICNQFVIWFYVLLKKRETMIQSIDWKKNTQNKTKNKIPLSIWIQHISWWLNIYNSTDDNNSIRSSSSVIRFCSFFIISSIKVILFLLTSFFFSTSVLWMRIYLFIYIVGVSLLMCADVFQWNVIRAMLR